MHVACHSDARRDFDARVEHPEERSELRVLDDGERAVTTCTPHSDVETKSSWRVRRARSVGLDELDFSGVRWLASTAMPDEIPGRILVVGTVNELGWMAV